MCSLTSVSSKIGLSLESIVLSVFEFGFKLPASIHNFFQSPSVNIDLLSENWKEKFNEIVMIYTKCRYAKDCSHAKKKISTFMRCTGDSLCHMILINPFDGVETNDYSISTSTNFIVAFQIEFMTQ